MSPEDGRTGGDDTDDACQVARPFRNKQWERASTRKGCPPDNSAYYRPDYCKSFSLPQRTQRAQRIVN